MKIFGLLIVIYFTLNIAAPCQAEDLIGTRSAGHPMLSSAMATGGQMRPFNRLMASQKFDSTLFLKKELSSEQTRRHKDRKTAFFRSLILPGAGQYYVEKRTIGQTFLAAEVTLWLSHFAFQQYGKWVRKDALAYAATHSGAMIKGKPSQFFVDIGNYSDVYQYNEAKLRFSEYEKVYSESEYFWSWDEDDHRQKFQNLRIASDRARNRATYVFGAIFANHLISAVHATWQAVRYNKNLDQTAKASIHIRCFANSMAGQIMLQIEKEF